ncbi:MAG TPA: hypothetical protein VNA18_02975 [Nitrososphaeraceae archaeon]|nr:hypothetical protein [Nitrososphaeraceae archaeon]
METGIISETKFNKTRQMELMSWVFATANSCKKIITPLLSRFLVLEIPEYTYEQFMEIAVARLRKEKVDETIAIRIAKKFGVNWAQTLEMLSKYLDYLVRARMFQLLLNVEEKITTYDFLCVVI